jgi:glycosyltransferase involved in cell wall biosynthesis
MTAEVGRQGLNGRVHFIGFVDDDDLPALYSAASLLTFPSFYEGFGLPLLEAMACGVPVISSNASSLPEVVGDSGLLLSPHDEAAWSAGLNELLADPLRRARMVADGFRQARQFTWVKVGQELLSLYQNLIQA